MVGVAKSYVVGGVCNDALILVGILLAGYCY